MGEWGEWWGDTRRNETLSSDRGWSDGSDEHGR